MGISTKQKTKIDVSEYDSTYTVVKWLNKVVGIRLTFQDPPAVKHFWNALYWFIIINDCISFFCETTAVGIAISNDNLIILFTMMPCIGYLLMALVKSFKTVSHRSVYENLILELRELWPKDTISKKEYDIIRVSLTQIGYAIKAYVFSFMLLTMLFVSPPYLNLAKVMIGRNESLTLAFSYWLPFDPYLHGRYEALVLLQTWHCFNAVVLVLGSDLLFCIFISHITMQFDLLAERIKIMFYVPVDRQLIAGYPLGKYAMEYHKEEKNLDVNDATELERQNQKEVIEVVLKHRTLLRLSADVENMFSFPLLVNYMNSSIIICFTGFCSVFVEEWKSFMFKLFLFTATLQIWLLSWFGQKLYDSSKGIAEAVYSCGWYSVPKKIQSTLIILFYRSQRGVVVTTYGFSIISMTSYSTILKTSWSYLMLLINIVRK